MMFEPDAERDGGFFSRLVSDPVRLRGQARWAALIVTLINAASSELSGTFWNFLYAFTWLCLPFISLALGYGAAFFIGYGREVRSTLLYGIGGAVISLLACVLLSTAELSSESTGERIISASASGVLYAGLLLVLSALVGFGLGRGVGYAGRRIQEIDDEDW